MRPVQGLLGHCALPIQTKPHKQLHEKCPTTGAGQHFPPSVVIRKLGFNEIQSQFLSWSPFWICSIRTLVLPLHMQKTVRGLRQTPIKTTSELGKSKLQQMFYNPQEAWTSGACSDQWRPGKTLVLHPLTYLVVAVNNESLHFGPLTYPWDQEPDPEEVPQTIYWHLYLSLLYPSIRFEISLREVNRQGKT